MAGSKKGALKEGRTLLFADEAGFYLLPATVRTWAPLGQTPVLRETGTRDHLSVIAAVSPEGRLYTRMQETAFNGRWIVVFLEHLLRQIVGPLTLMWDGATIHDSEEVKAFLSAGAATRLRLVPLPGYAPDLNPTEGVWGYLKGNELGNVACHDLIELRHSLERARERLRRQPALLRSFFCQRGFY